MENKKEILWKSRAMRDGDDQAIFDLYEAAIGRHIERREWEWIFRLSPAGPAFVHVADHGGLMAGQYAITRANLQVQGRRVAGAQSFDTMTHPNYRKQGIFTVLAKDVYAHAAAEGVELIYGFPNENSTHGFIKHLGFFIPEQLPIVWRPLRAADMLRLKIGSGFVRSLAGTPAQAGFDLIYPLRAKRDSALEIQAAQKFPVAESDELFQRLSPKFPNMVVRDAKFLKWRYEDNPRFKYNIFLARRGARLDGYCVTRYGEQQGLRICHVIDIFADPAAATGLVAYALREAAKTASAAFCLLQPESPFMPLLKKLGFIFTLKKIPFILRINSDAITRPMIEDIGQWHITYGDGDFV